MANISLTLYTNSFFGSVLMSPIQLGSLSVNNSVTNISRLGTFKSVMADPRTLWLIFVLHSINDIVGSASRYLGQP
jgi:hypothetical protein